MAWDAFESVSDTGTGMLFGLGWDVRVAREPARPRGGRNVSLTPFYNGFAVGVSNATFYADQFGLGVTIH